ncbi:hypothetical protein N8371_03300 [Vicingaceae bacterium]|nr:hypothetical protein [Vicingaceae bacterium]
MADNNFNSLLQKLDEFIRKFYVNQIIRGVILFLSLSFILFLSIVILEYFGEFGSAVRTGLFFGFAMMLLAVFSILIAIPLLKIISIGKRISHEKASSIIGLHFSNVSDKLSNALQLQQLSENGSSDLLIASINQKIEQLDPVPFAAAVNFQENKKYLKFLLVPLLVIIGLAAFQPKVIKDSTQRIISYNEEFVKKAPYQVVVENENLTAFKNEDFRLKISLTGEEIPNQLNVIYQGKRFLLSKKGKNNFEYEFKNLQKDMAFSLFDGEFESKLYNINTLEKPQLLNFKVAFEFPEYLKKQPRELENTGDITVPQGTKVRWFFSTENTDDVAFIGADTISLLVKSAEDEFAFEQRFLRSAKYGLSVANKYLQFLDTVFYNISVIPDARPSIEVDTKIDSANQQIRYFKGLVKDDYGFSQLNFYRRFVSKDDSVGTFEKQPIPINLALPATDFYHSLNLEDYQLAAGDEVEYYFEIWDNDRVNGSKSTRTQTFKYKAPTKEELSKKNKETDELVKKQLEENIKLTKEIKEDLDALKEKLLNKKELGFQEKKQVQALIEKQKKVQQSMEKLQRQNKDNNQMQEKFSKQDEALLEKQRQLQEMFEKVMTEEMKAMMREMEEIMEKMKKDDVQKSLEQMELNNEELEKELDRNLELFKQLEVEKQLAEAKEKLDELRKEQAELKKETEDKKTDAKENKKKQDELNKKMEEVSKELEDVKKKNKELERPNDLEDTKKLEEDIKGDMKESSEELGKKNKKKAGEEQQNAGEKMNKLSQKLSEMQQQMSSESNAENLEDLRALLENIIQLSFDQEEVMEKIINTSRNDPRYVELAQQQKKLKDDSKIVEDSLFTLSKRIQKLEAARTINQEMTAVNFNMEKAIEELQERRTPQASKRQQLAMTSLNNLALLLDNSVQQMQQFMMQSNGKCKKPGNGKPKPGKGSNPSNIKSLQQQLNKQMEALKKAMEEGSKPGERKKGQKPGQGKPGQGNGGMSKELALMSAKQSAIRKLVEKLQEEIGESNGQGGGNMKKLGDLMEQTETDLVNKQITSETLLRQEEILTRLLESERAENEREKDEKREATEAVEQLSRNPNTFFEYNKRKDQEMELMRTLPPAFNSYYKLKVSEYFNQIEK